LGIKTRGKDEESIKPSVIKPERKRSLEKTGLDNGIMLKLI